MNFSTVFNKMCLAKRKKDKLYQMQRLKFIIIQLYIIFSDKTRSLLLMN